MPRHEPEVVNRVEHRMNALELAREMGKPLAGYDIGTIAVAIGLLLGGLYRTSPEQAHDALEARFKYGYDSNR